MVLHFISLIILIFILKMTHLVLESLSDLILLKFPSLKLKNQQMVVGVMYKVPCVYHDDSIRVFQNFK